MKSKEILAILLFSFILWLLLSYVNNVNGLFLYSVLYFISLSFSALLFLSRQALTNFQKESEDKKEIITLLSRILYYRAKGSSLSKNLSIIIETTRSTNLKIWFNEIKKRMQLGADFSDAINFRFSKTLKSLDITFFESINGPYSQISQALSIYWDAKKEKSSISIDSLQRSSTIGMFLSTLLPSFVLFAFVGMTIISQTSLNLLPLSFVILIGIPLIYTLNNASFMRRLIVETT